MAVLPIAVHPDPVLRKRAEKVTDITPQIVELLHDMADTMYEAKGIGLAAPQIGVSKRLVVMDVSREEEDDPRQPVFMINPEVTGISPTMTVLDEGCLSLPEMRVEVKRPDRVMYRYTNIHGEVIEDEADDLLAKCIQHEIDHLDGKLIFDYLSPLKRDMTLRRYTKKLKATEA